MLFGRKTRDALVALLEFLRRKLASRPLPVLLSGAFVLLYLNLFRLPGTPIFIGEDQNLFLLDATRMLHGEMIYRDFFELTTPGIVLVNFALFKVFGPHAWIPNAALLLVGLGLVWLITALSRRVLQGPSVFLPGALFLAVLFAPMLDDTHQWYSAMASLGAVLAIIDKRSRNRLLAAGALCGLASFFTQTKGAFTVLGLAIFLGWEARQGGHQRKDILRRWGYLLASYVATFFAMCGYFIWKAGLARFLYCTVGFVLKYYPADRTVNSLAVVMFDIPEMTQWHDWFDLAVYVFLHALLPLVYVWFWWRRRRGKPAAEKASQLMLFNITGILALAAVAPSPSTYRLSAVAPWGLILLVWLIGGEGRRRRAARIGLWIVIACFAMASALPTQTEKLRLVDLPRGRLAMDATDSERFLWLAQHTAPGDYSFEASYMEVYFPLGLRDPAEIPGVKPNAYTRPEQVSRTVAALEKHRVRLVISDPGLEFQSESKSRENRMAPKRGLVRTFFHRIKELLGGDNRSRQDNLGPLRAYIRAHYHLTATLPGQMEVWERNP